jgi:hypothetical protein
MKRLFAIFLLVFLAIGSAGFNAGTAAAGPANCAFDTAATIEKAEKADAMADLVALTEKMSPRTTQLTEAPQYACNSSCARACSARFGSCGTRECRQQFSACVRSCGC